jgi:hypothetical protein
MDREIAKQLWDLVYTTFERRPGDVARTTFASKAVTNEVQFRLMHNIAALRSAKGDELHEIAGSVLADVLLCEASGWMTIETSNKMQDLLVPYTSVE